MLPESFHISSFGCRASQAEGASLEDELLDSGVAVEASPYQAGVVIINSCTVTEEADRDVRQMIRRVSTQNPKAKIIVTGCYAQRAPQELSELPGVSYVVGNSHKSQLGQLTLRVLNEDLGFPSTAGRAEIFCSDIFLDQELRQRSHAGSAGRTRAIVKVQDGCNANCSFCIIPAVRGRSRSLRPELVIHEVRSLVEREYREIVLSGIHLGSYGRDLDARTSLYELIRGILRDVPELERVRLSSIEPMEVTPEIIDLVAGEPRLAHHFHVPLQSGSSRVLREMRRPYSALYYAELLDTIHSRIEDAAIGADVMVGFPGESDHDFNETCRLIENAPLSYLHVFPYSSRPGTHAADLPFPVPAHVSRFRAKHLRQLIAAKNEAFRRRMIGRDLDVLVLRSGEAAISSNFIHVYPTQPMTPNAWVRVRATALQEEGLAGKLEGQRETRLSPP